MMLYIPFLQMIVCSGILFGYYWLFLRNKKFHHYNRFYLLGATCLSVVAPFIKIPIDISSFGERSTIIYNSLEIISVNHWEEELIDDTSRNGTETWFTINNTVYVIYILGVVILLYLFYRSLLYIHQLSKKYPLEHINVWKFYNTNEPGTPFSFFRSIFWNQQLDLNSKEGQQIFRHELFHVKQRHSSDIIFMECISAVLWINPFFHLIKKEIKAIHEFLADQDAISNNDQYDYAELLIVQSLNAKKNPIANYFFQNHLKRRIAMITKFKKNNYSYWGRLTALPLSILLFCAIVVYAQAPHPNTIAKTDSKPFANVVKSITVLVDAGHGGQDAGTRNDRGVQEKDVALAIARQIQQHAASYNINVVMTRDDDKYPGIKERADMAKTVNADMIISLHVAGNNVDNVGGFDFYITNKNQQTVGKSRILSQEIARQISSIYTVGGIKQRKEQGIWILDAVSCPSVIIECGYITNEKDMEFITQPDNQQKIAKGILQGIVKYQSASGNQSAMNDTIPVENRKKDSLNKRVDRQAREQQVQLQKLQEIEAVNQKMKEQIRNKKQHLNQRQLQLQAKQRTLNKEHLQKISKQKQLLVQKEQDRKLLEHKIHYEKQLALQKEHQNKLLDQKIHKDKKLQLENQKKITVLQEKINKENLIALEKQKQIQNKLFEQRIRDEKQPLQKQQQMKLKQQALAEVQINKNKKTRLSNIQRNQQIEYDRQKMLKQKLKEIENQKQQLQKLQKKIEQEINEANQLKNKPSSENWD